MYFSNHISSFFKKNKNFIVTIWQDRIIARMQQPYSLDCIPVEAEYQVGEYNLSLN